MTMIQPRYSPLEAYHPMPELSRYPAKAFKTLTCIVYMYVKHITDVCLLTACPQNTYSTKYSQQDERVCRRCPDPHHQAPEGSVAVTDCLCRDGYRPQGALTCSKVCVSVVGKSSSTI